MALPCRRLVRLAAGAHLRFFNVSWLGDAGVEVLELALPGHCLVPLDWATAALFLMFQG
jgi:hypothetical protein